METYDKSDVRVTYLRDEHGFPWACIAAIKHTDLLVAVGFSTWNGKDTFDKTIAREIAIGRAAKLIDRMEDNGYRSAWAEDKDDQGWAAILPVVLDMKYSDDGLSKRIEELLAWRINSLRDAKPKKLAIVPNASANLN